MMIKMVLVGRYLPTQTRMYTDNYLYKNIYIFPYVYIKIHIKYKYIYTHTYRDICVCVLINTVTLTTGFLIFRKNNAYIPLLTTLYH